MLKVTDKQFWIDPYLKSNLDILKKAVRNKYDCIICVDGMEGTGKTVLGATVSYYLAYDENRGYSRFNLRCFAWTPEDIERAILRAPPRSAILCDEFVMAGLSSDAGTQMQNTLIKYFTLIRKKQLYIVLIIPYFFMLRKYFAIARTRALIHVTTKDGVTRGTFKFYNYEQKRFLYFNGQKTWSYNQKNQWSFNGEHRVKSITQLGIDEEEYERLKDKSIRSLFVDKKNKDQKYKRRFYKALEILKEKNNVTWKDMPKLLGLDVSWQSIQKGYSRYIEKVNDEKEKDAEKKRVKFRMPGE